MKKSSQVGLCCWRTGGIGTITETNGADRATRVWAVGGKQALAPILFQDNDKPAAHAKRANPVAPARRSNAALAKASRKRTADNYPVHSFTSLLADLVTICANYIQPADDMPTFTMITTPTQLQQRAFNLLGVSHRHGYA
jgi:hypothetical protein